MQGGGIFLVLASSLNKNVCLQAKLHPTSVSRIVYGTPWAQSRGLDHAWFTSNKLLLIYNISFHNEVETKDLRTVRCSSSCSTSNEGRLFCGFEVYRLLAYQVVRIGLEVDNR